VLGTVSAKDRGLKKPARPIPNTSIKVIFKLPPEATPIHNVHMMYDDRSTDISAASSLLDRNFDRGSGSRVTYFELPAELFRIILVRFIELLTNSYNDLVSRTGPLVYKMSPQVFARGQEQKRALGGEK